MNCFNQQFSGMTDYSGQDYPTGWQGRQDDKGVPAWRNRMPQKSAPDWQGSNWGAGMPGWNGQADSSNMFFWQSPQPGFEAPSPGKGGMDCGMPPAAIAPVPALPAAMPRETPVQPLGTEKMGGSNFACKMEAGKFPIAMGYVPMQQWRQPRPIAEGFQRGTIFTELDLPFMMGRCQ